MKTLTARETKGIEIAKSNRLSKRGSTWFVPSQSGRGKYTVIAAGVTRACSCPDFEATGKPCKHIYAVEYTMTETLNVDGTRTLTQSMRITYRQDWPAYNAAQVNEKRTFVKLLADLCDGIEGPEQAMGRPRLSLRDMVFGCAYKVYSTVSARRFMTDLAAVQEKGFIDETPCYNSIINYFDKPALTPLLKALIERSAQPLKAIEQDFAIDSSGFTTCTYARWTDQKYGEAHSSKVWLKAHLMCGVTTNVVTSVEITQRFAHDGPELPELVSRTSAAGFLVREVSGDKAYLSAGNLEAIEAVGAKAMIPFKINSVAGNGSTWDRAFHYFSLHRERFLKSYHKRSNVETTFSMIKAKFGAALRSKTETAQINEALLKVLAHNLCCLISAMHELGVEPSFGKAA